MTFASDYGWSSSGGARRLPSSIVTVTTAANSNDLTTKAKVKSELGITTTDEDVNIATWITQASAAVAVNCRRTFGLETLSEQFRLSSYINGRLQLSRFPVSTITSVTENDTLLTATDDYEFDAESGLVTRLSGDVPARWPWGKIVVVYSAGYDLLDALPHPIERAVILLVKHYRSGATRDPMLKAEQTNVPGVLDERQEFWVGGIGGQGGLPTEVSDLIAPYRRVLVA